MPFHARPNTDYAVEIRWPALSRIGHRRRVPSPSPDLLLNHVKERVDFVFVVTAFSDRGLRESHVVDLLWSKDASRRISQRRLDEFEECVDLVLVVTAFSAGRPRKSYVVDLLRREETARRRRRPADGRRNRARVTGGVRLGQPTFQFGDAFLRVVLVHEQMVPPITRARSKSRTQSALPSWVRSPPIRGIRNPRRHPPRAPLTLEMQMIGSIILAIIVGALIGLVARLVMPGKQNIGMIMTVVLGAVGGWIGSAVAGHFGYHNANGGVAWIPFFVGVGAAIVLIAIYEGLTGRRTGTRLPR